VCAYARSHGRHMRFAFAQRKGSNLEMSVHARARIAGLTGAARCSGLCPPSSLSPWSLFPRARCVCYHAHPLVKPLLLLPARACAGRFDGDSDATRRNNISAVRGTRAGGTHAGTRCPTGREEEGGSHCRGTRVTLALRSTRHFPRMPTKPNAEIAGILTSPS